MLELPEELVQLRSVAKSVAQKLAVAYVERDLRDEWVPEVLPELARAGLIGLDIPEEAGGQGAGKLAAGVVCEEIAYGDVSVSSVVTQCDLVGNLLRLHADSEVAAEWLPRLVAGEITAALGITEPGVGSDLRRVSTRATREGSEWVLRGEKSSISFPYSGVFIVMARAEDGLALFVVPGDAPGISSQRLDDLGMHLVGRGVKIFDDVRIPLKNRLGQEGTGLRQLMAAFATSKVMFSLTAVGAARASLDEAIAWAKERETFGAPIAARQGVAFPLAMHSVEIEMARLSCWKALDLADRGLDFRMAAAQAKAWVPRHMFNICHDAVLTLGHVAYSREHPAQARLRDVIGTELGEGTEQTQLILVARYLTGINAN